jgi:CSLREA domain-containing protein
MSTRSILPYSVWLSSFYRGERRERGDNLQNEKNRKLLIDLTHKRIYNKTAFNEIPFSSRVGESSFFGPVRVIGRVIMNKVLRLSIPLVAALFVLMVGFFLVNASAASVQPAPDMQAALLVTTLEDELNTDGDCSLREAIKAANNNAPVDACPAGDAVITDTISFELAGTITVIRQLVVTASGPLVVDGEEAITISGGGMTRVLFVETGSELTLQHLDVVDGFVMGHGGGLKNNGGFLTIIDCAFSNNGVSHSDEGGGAIYNGGSLTVIDSILSSNNATYDQGGGGIYNTGTLTLTNSTLKGNYAYNNGGAIINGGVAIVASSSLSGNWVLFNGGAIENFGTMVVTNSTFSGNSSDLTEGGAINNYGTMVVINSILSGNSADIWGGAIYNDSILTVTNSTLSGNSGVTGGAIYSSGLLTAINTIVASSLSGDECYGSIIDGGHNISSDDSCGFDPANGSLPNTNPRLGPLQDNGGATWTHALLVGSPAIDAGDDAQCPETDQRGVPRPLDGNGDNEAVCDIGSYEFEYGISLYPSQQSAAAARGDILEYTIQLNNNTLFTDTYSLTLGPHTWETSLSTDLIGPIASGFSETFAVSVTIPWNADWYLTDTVVIKAASVTSPTIFSATARITSQAYAPPEISLFPLALEATLFSGDIVTRTLTTSNGDGVTLTFDISEAADWLSVEPDSGEVGTSSSLPVQVTMDAAGQQAGVYTASLYVNSNDPDDLQIHVPVTMTVMDLPIEGLSAENDSPTLYGSPTTLSATIINGTNVFYIWNFGDGSIGNGQVVMHTYPAVGVFTATVTAENNAGSATATTLPVILDLPIEGLAAFNDSPTLLGSPTTLSATVSAGTNVVYTWDYGDGEMGNGQVLTHTYPAEGAYTATVTATNTSNSLSASTLVTITVSAPTYWEYLPLVIKAGELPPSSTSEPPSAFGWAGALLGLVIVGARRKPVTG